MEINEEHLHMEEFERNQKWFIENFKRILEEYREKFVAVWNQRIIDADTDLEKLSKKVKEKTKSAKGVYVEYVSEKPVEMIKTPVFVLKHPLEEMMNEEERIKILRFPSILGRDVISRFRLIFDRVKGELLLTREEKEEVAKHTIKMKRRQQRKTTSST